MRLDQHPDGPDPFLEYDARLLTFQLDLADRRKDVGRSHGGVSSERQLASGSEDSEAASVFALLGRQDENRLREVELVRGPLHLGIREAPGVWEHGQWVSAEGVLGEDVGDVESVAH